MALQPYEVCSVAPLLRESDEVFVKQSCRLVHSSGLNPFLFLFKLTVIPCSCHIASWERHPPEQRGQNEVWELCTDDDAFPLSSQPCGCSWRKDAQTKWGTTNSEFVAGARNASVSLLWEETWAWGLLGLLWVDESCCSPDFVRWIFKDSLCGPRSGWILDLYSNLPSGLHMISVEGSNEMRYLMRWSTASDHSPVWVQQEATAWYRNLSGPGWRPVTVRWVLCTWGSIGELPDFPWLQLGQKEYKNKVDSG